MLDVGRDEMFKLEESIAYSGRWIWWANLWIGYAKFLFGFAAAAFMFGRTVAAAWTVWGLAVPFVAAFLLRDWLPRVWKRMPEAK